MLNLPNLIKLEDFGGNWGKYIDAVYMVFKVDFLDKNPTLNGKRIILCNKDLYRGKENTFWHITSAGKEEEERIPDFSKCERIRWIDYYINEANNDNESIVIWEEDRKVKISNDQWDYVIILIPTRNCYLLLTAYPVEREHRRLKIKKSYLRSKSA
ncbi:oxidoreductase [Candidatus Peregrinibacteria bacterium]|nr:oxidoreductase [Candidatus Peregrinibacteria bacterium]